MSDIRLHNMFSQMLSISMSHALALSFPHGNWELLHSINWLIRHPDINSKELLEKHNIDIEQLKRNIKRYAHGYALLADIGAKIHQPETPTKLIPALMKETENIMKRYNMPLIFLDATAALPIIVSATNIKSSAIPTIKTYEVTEIANMQNKAYIRKKFVTRDEYQYFDQKE